MQAGHHSEDKFQQILKDLSFFTAGAIFIEGLNRIFYIALIESDPYYRQPPEALQIIKLQDGQLVFQFCFALIAYGILSLNALSTKQRFFVMIGAFVLSLVQFILAMVGQIKMINFIKAYSYGRLHASETYEIDLGVVQILLSALAGISFSLWAMKAHRSSLQH